MPSENDFVYFEKCQAKLVSVRLNKMKFRARTLSNNDLIVQLNKYFMKNYINITKKL